MRCIRQKMHIFSERNTYLVWSSPTKHTRRLLFRTSRMQIPYDQCFLHCRVFVVVQRQPHVRGKLGKTRSKREGILAGRQAATRHEGSAKRKKKKPQEHNPCLLRVARSRACAGSPLREQRYLLEEPSQNVHPLVGRLESRRELRQKSLALVQQTERPPGASGD